MNTPSGAVSIFFTLFVGFGIRLQSHRWAFIIACLIPAYVLQRRNQKLKAHHS